MRIPSALAGTATLLALTLLPACDSSPRSTVTQQRSDSAGVEIVRVDGAADTLAWGFRERWRVGGADDGVTGFSDLSRWNVAPAPDRTLAVLDEMNHRVVVLDAAGDVVRTYGGRGGGPGEMQGPGGLGLGPDGAVWVWDGRQRTMVRFAPDGAPLEPGRVEGRVWGGLVRPGTDGVHVGERYVAGQDTMMRSVTRVSMDDEARLFTVALPRPDMVEVPGCGGVRIPIGPMYARDLKWDAEGRRVAVFVGPEYVVDVYDDGRHALSLRMATPLRPVTEELAARQYPDGFRLGLPGGDCVADPIEMVRAQGFEPHLPAVAALRVTPAGEVWVQRGHLPGEPAVIDIWSPDGDYVGTLPAGTSLPAAFLPDGAVAVVEEDEWDVPRLVVLGVERE